jgi:hypothetical protein
VYRKFSKASSTECVIIKTRKNIKARWKLLEMVTSIGLQGFNSRNASGLGYRTAVIFMFVARGTGRNNNLHKDYNKNSLPPSPSATFRSPWLVLLRLALRLNRVHLARNSEEAKNHPFSSRSPAPPSPSL